MSCPSPTLAKSGSQALCPLSPRRGHQKHCVPILALPPNHGVTWNKLQPSLGFCLLLEGDVGFVVLASSQARRPSSLLSQQGNRPGATLVGGRNCTTCLPSDLDEETGQPRTEPQPGSAMCLETLPRPPVGVDSISQAPVVHICAMRAAQSSPTPGCLREVSFWRPLQADSEMSLRGAQWAGGRQPTQDIKLEKAQMGVLEGA